MIRVQGGGGEGDRVRLPAESEPASLRSRLRCSGLGIITAWLATHQCHHSGWPLAQWHCRVSQSLTGAGRLGVPPGPGPRGGTGDRSPVRRLFTVKRHPGRVAASQWRGVTVPALPGVQVSFRPHR